MTEAQAKSGAAQAPAKSLDEEADHSSPTVRSAVGRATVPAGGSPPKFTRAPGMPPPPEKPTGDQGDGKAEVSGERASAPGAAAPLSDSASADRSTEGKAPSGDGPASSAPPASDRTKPGAAQPGATANQPSAPPVIGRIPAAPGVARVGEAMRAARSRVSSAAARGPRRARLKVKRVDPWSVMKFSFAVSFVLFVVVIVASSVLYLALDAMGVFESVNGSLTDLVSASGGQGGGGFQITAFGVIGSSALIGLINMVLFPALATLAAFIYNVCADLVGGIEITLAERD